jgi:hypothetical protein
VGDKDDGWCNVFRHNVLHGAERGIGLENQYSQAEIEVSYNLTYDAPGCISVGWQPGYLRDVWIHHNTLAGTGVTFSPMLAREGSGNINVYSHVIVTARATPGDYPRAVQLAGARRRPRGDLGPRRGRRQSRALGLRARDRRRRRGDPRPVRASARASCPRPGSAHRRTRCARPGPTRRRRRPPRVGAEVR